MTDNYPVLCTVRYKDRLLNVTQRIRIKPVLLEFGICRDEKCYRSMRTDIVGKNGMCRSCFKLIPQEFREKRMLFKIYTASSSDVVNVESILRKVAWKKHSKFRRSQSFHRSNEVFFFKQSYVNANVWFAENSGMTDEKPCEPIVKYRKKLSVTWEKAFPEESVLMDLWERRRLLKAI